MKNNSGVGKGLIIFRHRHSQLVAGIELDGSGASDFNAFTIRICGGERRGLKAAHNLLDRKGLGIYAVFSRDSTAGEPRGIISGNLHLSTFRCILG